MKFDNLDALCYYYYMIDTQTAPQALANDWKSRHRGPYTLHVVRAGKKKGSIANEWLSGQVDSDDVDDEVQALLDDPRDSILFVNIWSVRHQQFVMTFRGEGRAQ